MQPFHPSPVHFLDLVTITVHGQATCAISGAAAALPQMSDPLHSFLLRQSRYLGGAPLSTPPWRMGPNTTPLSGQARTPVGCSKLDTPTLVGTSETILSVTITLPLTAVPVSRTSSASQGRP